MARFKKGSKAAKAYMASIRPKTARRRRTKKAKSVYRGESMARRRTSRRRSRSSGGMLGKLTKKKTLLYIGAASLFGGMIAPQIDPKLKTAAAGFMAAGIAGAAAGYFADPYIKSIGSGFIGGSTNSVSGMVYN